MDTKTIKTADNNFAAHFTCKAEGTRYGFRHVCRLDYYDLTDFTKNDLDGSAQDKACYYNRTWERYRFQTVMRKTVKRAIENRKRVVRADILREFNVRTLNNRGELFRNRCAEDETIKRLNEVYEKL